MSNSTKETVLAVEGMTCGSCIRHVKAALSELPGVGAVEVSLKDGKVRVGHDPDGASSDEMIAALEGAGYRSRIAGSSAATRV